MILKNFLYVDHNIENLKLSIIELILDYTKRIQVSNTKFVAYTTCEWSLLNIQRVKIGPGYKYGTKYCYFI